MIHPRNSLPGFVARNALAAAGTLVHFALVAGTAAAGPTVGFVEDFPDSGNVAGWDGGATEANPGTGGLGGVGDGYLEIAQTVFAGRLGARNGGLDYAGDWLAAGADRVRFSLNDVAADQVLEIHFGIGNMANFWQYDVAFIPPENAWTEFTVNLRDSLSFTHIIDFTGLSTYSEALRGADRVLIRHDNAVYAQEPDILLGEVGVDGFRIENSLIGVAPGAPVAARRPVMLAPPAPNPSRGATALAFETFEEGPVTLAIVDARGRAVRSERIVPATIGRQAWTWDGRDGAGRSVAAGVYRVRAWGAAGGTSRAIVRVD